MEKLKISKLEKSMQQHKKYKKEVKHANFIYGSILTYQRVAIITHKYKCVNRTRMIRHTNSIDGSIFRIVIINYR